MNKRTKERLAEDPIYRLKMFRNRNNKAIIDLLLEKGSLYQGRILNELTNMNVASSFRGEHAQSKLSQATSTLIYIGALKGVKIGKQIHFSVDMDNYVKYTSDEISLDEILAIKPNTPTGQLVSITKPMKKNKVTGMPFTISKQSKMVG